MLGLRPPLPPPGLAPPGGLALPPGALPPPPGGVLPWPPGARGLPGLPGFLPGDLPPHSSNGRDNPQPSLLPQPPPPPQVNLIKYIESKL